MNGPSGVAKKTTGIRLLACVVLAFAFGCSGAIEPEWHVLPPPDRRLDPAAVQENRLLYGCGGWTQQPLKPDSQVVVDVFFARTSPSEQFSHPEEAHKRRILQNGGRIFYAFNFRGLRIQIAAGRIPMLSQGGTTFFYDVRNVRRFDWPVSVIYGKGTPFNQSDEALFEQLGGRITHRLHATNMLLGVLPDRSIPALRRESRVQFVEAGGGVYCLD